MKSTKSFTFSSRPPRKPPFPPKQRRKINLHEMSTYEVLQEHTHELKPDPSEDEAISEDPSIVNHDFKEDEQWGEVSEPGSSFDEISDYKHLVIVQHLPCPMCPMPR
jgi:hypothetical protein